MSLIIIRGIVLKAFHLSHSILNHVGIKDAKNMYLILTSEM